MSTNEWPRVHKIKCENAESFIEAISDIKQQLIMYGEEKNLKLPHINRNDFIYRGHADSDWGLIPSAYREDNQVLFEHFWNYDFGAKLSRPESRKYIINQFIKIADEKGLDIPGLDNKYKQRVLNYGDIVHEGITSGSDLVHRMALAQHYGIPTELLDWSKKPLIATYFASSNALHKMLENIKTAPKFIAVWVLNTNVYNYRGKDGGVPGDFPFQVHDVPRHGNTNLIAQQGIFTSWKHYQFDANDKKLGIESTAYDSIPHILPMLIKVTMSTEYVISLTKCLEENDVTASEIFPGYSGVAKCVIEKAMMCKLYHIMKYNTYDSLI